MHKHQIFGIAVLAFGAVLLGFAYHASNAPIDQLSNTLTGIRASLSPRNMIVGGASLVT